MNYNYLVTLNSIANIIKLKNPFLIENSQMFSSCLVYLPTMGIMYTSIHIGITFMFSFRLCLNMFEWSNKEKKEMFIDYLLFLTLL